MGLDILFILVPPKCIVIFKRSIGGVVLKGTAEFVARYPNFQQVKVEYQKLGGLTQVMNLPIWKW